ncbi:MAG: sulfotransferase [Pirellulaceae bacterium]
MSPPLPKRTASPAAIPKKSTANSYPWYSPRIWHGMRLRTWLSLLAKHRCAIHPLKLGLAATVTAFAASNSINYRLQNMLYGKRLKKVELKQPMIFILGHWRSGTTYLHELISLDDRFASPNTIQCFAPAMFLMYGRLIERWLNFMMPRNRPMDNMQMGFQKPQEDEFALSNMGEPSTYLRMAFPNHDLANNDYLDLRELTSEELAHWKATLDRFLRMVTLQEDKPLILKSPTHTGRIAYLSEMYPQAKFIHIARDPYDVYPSTIRLWQTMDEVQSFQVPKNVDYSEYVFRSFERMYNAYNDGVTQIAPERICQTRYEDMVKDPVGELGRIYSELKLADYDQVRSKIEAATEASKDYKKNEHQLNEATRREVNRRWGHYFEKYGYEMEGESR